MNVVGPFGDHVGDGIVQVCFSLPMPCSPLARRAAKVLAEKMGLNAPEVVHEVGLCSNASYYIIYGCLRGSVDVSRLQSRESAESADPAFSKEQIEEIVESRLGCRITVIGASTGSDTHSVGIDAILNHKGFGGNAGLEAYRGFNVTNLGSQVPNERLIAEALRIGADAILVSQTVTQQELHVANLTALVDMLEAEGLRDRFILVCGGARISAGLAKELGFDAGFSKGSYAQHVASFIVSRLLAGLDSRSSDESASNETDASETL
jgi:beta-lysine 5,6-aminomutase beta subunit